MAPRESLDDFLHKLRHIKNSNDKRRTKFDVVEISGSPTKWLNRGHNIFGCNDIEKCLSDFIREILAKAEIKLADWELQRVNDFKVFPTRIDLTMNFRCETENDVSRILYGLSTQATSSYQNRQAVNGQSVYFGKSSKVKTLLFYNKKEEFLKNNKKVAGVVADNFETIFEETKNLLRFELRLKSQWLRDRSCSSLRDVFSHDDYKNIMVNEMNKLNLGQLDLSEKELDTQYDKIKYALEGQRIKNSVLNTFESWRNGRRLMDAVSEKTYYKHRKLIEGITGIDVKNIRNVSGEAKVIPIITFVTAHSSEPSNEYKKLMYG